ncbi:MAG: hypothetical protein LBD10_09730 [Desulfobulbus sp.]|jgi:hypothetical protein|uniref:hypothetical protein n=1 Tax=Desulfobulbus sp. TaxID=895 RepID=UPI00283B0C43|nr:hypothetical protein [Desulfobulbus sp.]MDR2550462.1 hypothetical protein [Desulfobulbus sp.]
MTRLLALILLCLVLAVSGLLLAVRPAPEIALIDYLPENTLLFMEVEHPIHWDGPGRSGQNGKSVSATTWYKFLQQAGGSDTLIAETRKMIAAGEALAKHPLISSLLDHGAAFALLPERVGQTEFSVSRQWMVAVRLDDHGAEQRFEEMLARLQTRPPVSYQGEILRHLVADGGQEFFYWRHRNVVLAACEQGLLRRCIDRNLQRMIQKGGSLATNAAYLRLRQLSKEPADIFCYVDLEGLRRRVPLVQAIETESGGLLPRHLAFSGRAASNTTRLEFNALVTPASTAAFMTRHGLSAPIRQPSMEPMPPEVKLALWTNWFKPKYLWDFARQKSGDDVSALMALIGQQLSEATGKSLADFFDVFGEEFGVMITEQQVQHQSSRFMGGLLVALRDRPAMAAMIAQMETHLQVIKVKSGDLEIDSVMLAGGLLQPACALLAQHLILADSVELAEAVRRRLMPDRLDASQDKAPGSEIGPGNVSLFLRVGEMAEQLAPLLALLAKETGEWDRMLPPEARLFVREVGLPLLAGLHNVATGRVRGSMAGDILNMEVEYTLRGD